jgi:hypothetical protein
VFCTRPFSFPGADAPRIFPRRIFRDAWILFGRGERVASDEPVPGLAVAAILLGAIRPPTADLGSMPLISRRPRQRMTMTAAAPDAMGFVRLVAE